MQRYIKKLTYQRVRILFGMIIYNGSPIARGSIHIVIGYSQSAQESQCVARKRPTDVVG